MAEKHADTAIQQTDTTVKRRGILAAAGAVVAGIVANQVAQPVRAANGGSVILAANSIDNAANSATRPTYLFNTGGGTPTVGSFFFADAFVAASVTGLGVKGQSASGTGVQGLSDTFHGIIGQTGTGSGHAGIAGFGAGTGTFGVIGDGSGGGTGVQGQNAQFGVVGKVGTIANAVGVLGQSAGGTGIGVQGIAGSTGVGIYGTASGNTAVLGITTAPGFAGLGGIANVTGTSAFAGTSTNPNAFAGFFTGDVFVNGNFTVLDPTRKHGAIQHPDGSHRILYSMESPESWIEDFGTGQLVNGQAAVQLDADFAAVVQTDEYYVFLTDRGVRDRLTVTAQEATGFTVEAGTAGASGGFYWRVVAKPKTTNKAERMAKFTVPDIKVPQPPPIPNVPTAPVSDHPSQPAPPARPTASATTGSAPQGSGATQGSGPTTPVQPMPPPRSG